MRLAAALLLVLLTATAHAAPGDLVLRGGAVYTLNDKQPWAEAVVIRAGRIAYVGDEAGLTPYLEGARIVDLHGAMVLPGFHDAHVHPMSGAMRLLQCDLSGAKSLQDLAARVKAEDSAKHAWVFCNGVPEALGKDLGRAKLDQWVPDRPAFIRTADGFVGWANSRALAAGGLDPKGAGVLKGDDTSRVRGKVPAPSEAEYREALRRASAMANALGITSVFDAAAAPDLLRAYHDADLAGELTLRVTAAQRVDPQQGPAQVDEMVKLREHVRGKRFKADAAKFFLDGELNQHTAAMLAPYADAPTERGPAIPQDLLDAIVQKLDAAGFLIHMHAMGDGAVRAGLDAIEHAMQKDGAADRRDQIAHLGVVNPTDVPRFAKLGVTGNFTSLWFQPGDEPMLAARQALGPARAKWMYPMGSVLAAGGRVTLGSDWPQETMSPLDGIQYAVTRQPLDGSQPAPQPEQRISVAQAIAAYTRDAAWAVREDAIDGTIEAGRAADLVVLDQDLFKVDVMSIHKTRVLLTLLEGDPLYVAPGFTWPR
ncbi:MAG TPA: amidohydrolase [Gammaproteobacteria bacterium]|nr:amidohydrolase [Gammaproteobacteria bacterium]